MPFSALRALFPYIKTGIYYYNVMFLLCHRPQAGKRAFKFLCRKTQMELTSVGNRDRTRLLGNNDCKTVAFLRDSEGSSMTEAEALWDVAVVGNRKYASCCHKAVVAYKKCAVVKRRILEEYVFYQTLTDIGINLFSRIGNFLKTNMMLHNNKRTDFLLSHTHTRHDDGHNVGFVGIFFSFSMEVSLKYSRASRRTDC